MPIGPAATTTLRLQWAVRWTWRPGAKRLWVVMEHTTKDGASRLVKRCSYPLTALGAVSRVYTNLAVLDVTDRGFVVRDIVPGLDLVGLQAVTGAKLSAPV